MLEQPLVFGIGTDLGKDSINGNRQAVRVEKIPRMGIEHRDAALGIVEGNRVLFSDLEVAERQVAEGFHLLRHLFGCGGSSLDMRLRNNEAGLVFIEKAFQSDVISELPVVEDQTSEILRRKQFARIDSRNRKRRKQFVGKLSPDPSFSRMSGLPPNAGLGTKPDDMFAVGTPPLQSQRRIFSEEAALAFCPLAEEESLKGPKLRQAFSAASCCCHASAKVACGIFKRAWRISSRAHEVSDMVEFYL